MKNRFESPLLEVSVREKVRQYEGDLESGTLASITELDLSGRRIGSVRGIEGLVNLRSLCLNQNLYFDGDLSPLSALSNLSALQIRSCGVQDPLPLASLARLEVLDLSGNPGVRDLRSLAGLERLRLLDLGDTNVKDLAPLASVTALEVLRLSFAECRGIRPLIHLPRLRELDLSRLRLMDVPRDLAGLPALRRLDLSECLLSDVQALSSVVGLETLGLRDNKVREIAALAGLSQLRRLDLSKNPVTQLGPLGALRNLQWLDTRETEVRDWTPVAAVPVVLKSR